MPSHLIKQTFLEKLRLSGFRVIAIEVPGYNEKLNEKYRSIVKNYISKSISEKMEFVKEILQDCEERIERGKDYVSQGYDLVFVYLSMPDIAEHLFYKGIKDRIYLYSIHKKLEKLISPLLNMANENNYVSLIVSDHGFDFENYYHSDYGFYSLSKNIMWFKPRGITDFRNLIIRLINTSIENI